MYRKVSTPQDRYITIVYFCELSGDKLNKGTYAKMAHGKMNGQIHSGK